MNCKPSPLGLAGLKIKEENSAASMTEEKNTPVLLKRSAGVCFKGCDEQCLTFWNHGLGSLLCARMQHRLCVPAVKSLSNEGLLIFPTKGKHWKEKNPRLDVWGFTVASTCTSVSQTAKLLQGLLHEMCLETLSLKSCRKAWGDTWLCPENTWKLSKYPLESEAKFTCLQESGCAFPEKISWKGISTNSLCKECDNICSINGILYLRRRCRTVNHGPFFSSVFALVLYYYINI